MNHRLPGPGEPRREELAAYLDGELDAAGRARVQHWLAQQPGAAAAAEELRELAHLVKQSCIPEPEEAAWAATLDRIDRAVTAQRRSAAPLLARIASLIVPIAGAAAVLLALFLRPVAVESTQPEAVEPFPVVTPDDVELISLEHADRDAVLVGHSPLSEPIVLVKPGDMSDLQIKPDVDGMVPTVARAVEGKSAVVLVAPLGWTGVDDEE